MLTTVVSIFAAIALLMPGFVVVELSLARSARSRASDLELALRAVAYAVVVHVAFAWWTASLIDEVNSVQGLEENIGPATVYVVIVLILTPVLLGLLLNRFLARAEAGSGEIGLAAAALGAGEARDAFDYAFQRWRGKGAYAIIELVGHTRDQPRLVGGVFGAESAVGQTPSPHDVYLEALYIVEEGGDGVRSLTAKLDPARGIHISTSPPIKLHELNSCRKAPYDSESE